MKRKTPKKKMIPATDLLTGLCSPGIATPEKIFEKFYEKFRVKGIPKNISIRRIPREKMPEN